MPYYLLPFNLVQLVHREITSLSDGALIITQGQTLRSTCMYVACSSLCGPLSSQPQCEMKTQNVELLKTHNMHFKMQNHEGSERPLTHVIIAHTLRSSLPR